MSVNTAHAPNGVLLHTDEFLLGYVKCLPVFLWRDPEPMPLKPKTEVVYLTSHRLILRAKQPGDKWQSLSAPYTAIRNVGTQHWPQTARSFVHGQVHAQPGGNFAGRANFRIMFMDESRSGAKPFVDFLQRAVTEVPPVQPLPPYRPATAWHLSSPSAYMPPLQYEHAGWVPQHNIFVEFPRSIYTTDDEAPFPGIPKLPPLIGGQSAVATPGRRAYAPRTLLRGPTMRTVRFRRLQATVAIRRPLLVPSSEEDVGVRPSNPPYDFSLGRSNDGDNESTDLMSFALPKEPPPPKTVTTPRHCEDWIEGVNAPVANKCEKNA